LLFIGEVEHTMTRDSTQAVQWAAAIGGFCLGLQILVKASEKVPYFDEHPFRIGFLLAAGVFVTAGSLVFHRLERRMPHLHGLFHLIEGCVLVVSASLLFEKGKIRMPLVILFLGILYVVLGAATYWITPRNQDRVGRRLLKWMGTAFLGAGGLACGLNLANDRDGWVFVIGGLFLALGLLFTARTDWMMTRFGGPAHPVADGRHR
jgi:MFS family permease